MRMLTIATVLCVSWFGGVAARPLTAASVTTQSPDIVRQLVAAMSSGGLTAIAAREPGAPDHYVAAMMFPGVQLLVIRAQTSARDYVESELVAGRHEAVYAALHQGVPASKLFIQDMGSDGIRGTSGALADIVYQRGVDQHVLNGDHKAAKLSKDKYAALVRELDGEYTKLLALLLESANARLAVTTAAGARR